MWNSSIPKEGGPEKGFRVFKHALPPILKEICGTNATLVNQ
jgi:hypothetical protein